MPKARPAAGRQPKSKPLHTVLGAVGHAGDKWKVWLDLQESAAGGCSDIDGRRAPRGCPDAGRGTIGSGHSWLRHTIRWCNCALAR